MFIWMPSCAAGPEHAADWPSRMVLELTPGVAPNAGPQNAARNAMNVTRLIQPPCEDPPVPAILHCKNVGWLPSPSLLSEEFFDLLHPRLGAGVVSVAVSLADHLELAQQLPLSVGQVYRRFDDAVAKQVAVLQHAHSAIALAAHPI